MDKLKLIKHLSRLIVELCTMDEYRIEKMFKSGKATFRSYELNESQSQLLPVDIKIETKMDKKSTALTKARSALKKAEHVQTPLSIKRKLKTKEKKS